MAATFAAIFRSVLWRCWLDDRKGLWPLKSRVSVCWWRRSDWSIASIMAPVVTTTLPLSLAPVNPEWRHSGTS